MNFTPFIKGEWKGEPLHCYLLVLPLGTRLVFWELEEARAALFRYEMKYPQAGDDVQAYRRALKMERNSHKGYQDALKASGAWGVHDELEWFKRAK